MTRHSKNNTANPIFTYHERKKVKDFNSLKQRLGADSMRRCEQCWLCLSTAIKPVSTPEGYVFCKECILNCLATQLKDYKRRVAEWETQVELTMANALEEREISNENRKHKLLSECVYGVSTVKVAKRGEAAAAATAAAHGGDVPSPAYEGTSRHASAADRAGGNITEGGGVKLPEKPKSGTKCPITGKPLKMKELVDMNPDTSDEADEESTRTVWICAVSQKPISHHPALLDRKTGKVVLKRYVTVSDAAAEAQFIALIPGGTSFAAHNAVVASKYRPALL